MCKEAKRIETVVDSLDGGSFRCHTRTVIGADISGTVCEPVTINSEKHKEIVACEVRSIVVRWRPGIQIQTVLARGILAAGENAGIVDSLRPLRAELGVIKHAIPRMQLIRRFPAIGACWWSSERNASADEA